MRVVRAEEEQHDGDAEEELLGRRVLGSVVDLLPHVQVVVRPAVELEGHTPDVVEHDVGAHHVGDVGQGPGRLLRHAGHDVVDDFEGDNQNEVDGPCTWKDVNYVSTIALKKLFNKGQVEGRNRLIFLVALGLLWGRGVLW